jgi:hypothetical protein
LRAAPRFRIDFWQRNVGRSLLLTNNDPSRKAEAPPCSRGFPDDCRVGDALPGGRTGRRPYTVPNQCSSDSGTTKTRLFVDPTLPRQHGATFFLIKVLHRPISFSTVPIHVKLLRCHLDDAAFARQQLELDCAYVDRTGRLFADCHEKSTGRLFLRREPHWGRGGGAPDSCRSSAQDRRELCSDARINDLFTMRSPNRDDLKWKIPALARVCAAPVTGNGSPLSARAGSGYFIGKRVVVEDWTAKFGAGRADAADR